MLYWNPPQLASEQHVAQKAENAVASSEAFRYYASEERRKPLQDLINTVQAWMENDLASKGGLPAYSYGWNTPLTPPIEGYGVLYSKVPGGPGEFSVKVNVFFSQGKPDFSAGILGFGVYKDNKTYALEGETVLTFDGKPVENSARSYEWSMSEVDTDYKSWELRIIRSSGTPPIAGAPLSPGDYDVLAIATDHRSLASVDDVKRLDADFIAQVKAALNN